MVMELFPPSTTKKYAEESNDICVPWTKIVPPGAKTTPSTVKIMPLVAKYVVAPTINSGIALRVGLAEAALDIDTPLTTNGSGKRRQENHHTVYFYHMSLA